MLKKVVVSKALWYGTLPVAPPARFVAVVALVALVAVAALPEIEPTMVELTVSPDRVPTAVIPV
jgi:hypothetical protein